MDRIPRSTDAPPMNADEFAGFLRLWLTPASKLPKPSDDLEAYIAYAREREPLSEETQEALGLMKALAA